MQDEKFHIESWLGTAVQGDPEYQTRLDAERCTLEFGQKSTKRLDSGKQPITDSPLFGGPAQKELF